jgi:hypothetical protein
MTCLKPENGRFLSEEEMRRAAKAMGVPRHMVRVGDPRGPGGSRVPELRPVADIPRARLKYRERHER